MSEIVREMTLQEEIKSLPIDDSTKQRLLSKLKEYNYITEEHKALLAKTREEMYSKILPLEESCKEVEKLKRENFGLKTTVKNLRRQLDKFYHYR